MDRFKVIFTTSEEKYQTIFENDREWICGNKSINASPSFLTGVAGIGNFYLRMIDTNLIQSGLFLEELLK